MENIFDPDYVYKNFGGGSVIKAEDLFLGADGVWYGEQDHDCKGEKCTDVRHEQI